MATTAMGPSTCTLNIKLFSGARASLPEGIETLLTVRNGNQHNVPLPHNGFFTKPTINITGLPFFNNFGDNYAVVASAHGYQEAGFFPVKANPHTEAVVDIMLVKKDATFGFQGANWSELKDNYKPYAALLGAGTVDDAAAASRYEQLMKTQPAVLACYFNLVTAMAHIQLPNNTPLAYIRELIWDRSMAQDRFYCWASPGLVDQVIAAAKEKEFSPEIGTAIFHKGATRSWKQIQFGEANVQLTFHENDKKTIGGDECVMLEPDIDYYKDGMAHAFLEVVPNGVTHALTDPRQVYVLRWMAGRHAGVPSFEPPYTLE